ncbi:Large extracellular alpha-helical protein [Minicystis rosea]|nr:Large extracellular alpha-helical protein [Minicystis rosea]
MFLHAPDAAAPGARVPLQIEAFGFPTAITLAPLAGATVEAAWDPEHLGPGVTSAPPAVRAITDGSGRAHLDVPVPEGDERSLVLLVGLRSGGHERTRTIHVRRGAAHSVGLHVADTRVVPGSSVSAWVLVNRAETGTPAAGTKVDLALLEGGLPRFTTQLVTDAAGTAMARVPIPEADEPSWSWTLRARSLIAGDAGSGEGTVKLVPREETPGKPRLFAGFDGDAILAGDKAPFTLRARDANDLPIAGLPVRYWVGPKGTEPPKDADWERLTKLATTNAEGEVHASTDAPSLVVAGVGTTLRLVAKTEVEGHALAQTTTVSVGVPTSTATLSPEAGVIVPGVEQRLLLRVRDGHARPVAATFSIEGDGLASTVTTDAEGEAEVTWRPPVDVGAQRQVGPCAGGVAAAVTVRPQGEVAALKPRRDPFELCLSVDREASAIVRVDRPIARAGDRVRVRVLEAPAIDAKGRAIKPEDGPKRAWSVVLRSSKGEQAASAWIEDGEKGGDIEIPPGEPGAWTISAAAPSAHRAAPVAVGAIVVTPRVLPLLSARTSGGRAAPGGAVDVDVDLTDEKRRGLPGTVAAVVVDLHGGGSTWGIEMLDARRSICRDFGVWYERCDRFVEGDPALDALRRGVLGEAGRRTTAPTSDPGGSARAELVKTFGEVLRSLEGAVYEATQSADRLRDARRRGPHGYVWNPELMTLVTAAMDPPPRTPGGELLGLSDLMSVDAQVTFDNVARRVTRLKLFRVLAAVRTWRHEQQLDPDEPVFRDPNALLRKLVRDGRISEDLILDPWGGTLRFVPAHGPGLPFISAIRGFELHSPGPDGVSGNGDDVKDPFERVLKSGTPYAKAAQEDRLVDARFDMEVGEATVAAWQHLLEELTGTALGRGQELGLTGTGEGGGGMGYGSGHGRLGGVGRGSSALTSGVYWWSPPVRTDDKGHVRFHVPLGDAETTWRIALVGVPDGARQATTHVDVPVALPLSARVDTGAAWVEGDRVEAAVTVRNRSDKPVRAALAITASGVARLVDGKDASRTADVPAGGAAVVRVPVEAGSAGAASLAVTVRAPDLPDDTVRHTWQVAPAGEPMDLTRAQWIDGRGTLAVPVAGAAEGDKPAVAAMRLVGTPRLVIERGIARPLAAALEAMNPDRLPSRAALLDAVETGVRVQRWAIAQGGDDAPLAVRAAEITRRARGRLAAFGAQGGTSDWLVKHRLRVWVPPEKGETRERPSCPPAAGQRDDDLTTLESEPPPESGAALSCWDALASSAMDQVNVVGDPVLLARAFLAVADRPHRAALAATLIDRLREKIALRPSGAVTLPEAQAKTRAARAFVYAALLQGARLGKPSAAPADRLMAWVAVQRDADGGYGSAAATRAVVRALLAAAPANEGPSHVLVKFGATRTEVEVPASARIEVPLDAQATAVDLEVQGPGVLARLERPVVRPWSRPPEAPESPLAVDVAWPTEARAGTSGVVSVSVRHNRGRATSVDLRLPLPPGVTLAESVADVRQVQGTILARRALDPSGLPVEIILPVRFGLAGRVTVPEARAVVAHDEAPRALAPARPLVIK